MAKHRADRINEEYKHTVASVIRELKDPRIPMMTSVIGVRVTPDLKYAKVAVSVMGDEAVEKDALKALNAAKGYVRREVSQRMKLRASPEISFVIDNSIEYGAHIQNILKMIEKESDPE